MKLRIALKVMGAIHDEVELGKPPAKNFPRHRAITVNRAWQRTEKTKSSKEANKYWNNCMEFLGKEGRAKLVEKFKTDVI